MSVLLGDGIAGLAALPVGSVDLVLSDLPSGETRAPFDHKADLGGLWWAIGRALRPGGVVALMASSFRFACEVRASGPSEPVDLVWHKSLATGHLNSGARPLRAHEFVLVFLPQRGGQGPCQHTYHPQMVTGASPIHAARRTSHGENYGPFSRATDSRAGATDSRAGATDRYPTSVLEFASVGTTARERRHPQQKPVPLMRYLIETFTNPGDLVVDPYAGSGSTGEATVACGRRFLGWDSDPRFGAEEPAVIGRCAP